MAQPVDSQQRSVKIDDAFVVACRNTGVTLEELEAKTANDFNDGAAPSISKKNQQNSTTSSAASLQMPKDVLERRLKNYETLRLRKLHVVLVERDRLIKKGFVNSNGDSSAPATPTASAAPPSSYDAAPPLSARKGSNIPKPPSGNARGGGAGFSRSSVGNNSATDAPLAPKQKSHQPSPRSSKGSPHLNLEPLDFGDGDNQQSGSGSGSNATTPHFPPVSGAVTSNPTYEYAGNGTMTQTNNGGGSGRAKPTQRDVLLDQAQRQHKQRTLQAQRIAQAQMLKTIREEEQQRAAVDLRLRQEDEAKRRSDRQHMVQSSNQVQQENRARRDDLLRQMREENARAHVEMGELELESKAQAILEVRTKQQQLVEEKKEKARLKNEMAMRNARDRMEMMAMRQEIDLEKKGLLASVYGPNYSTTNSPRNAGLADDDYNGTTASGSGGGEAGQGESARKRQLKKEAEEQRFQEKHIREAQRIATAQQLAEQNRLKVLKNIYDKERKCQDHMSKEMSARDAYISQNNEVSKMNMEIAKQTRNQREQESQLYREMLESERSETQVQRDKRVILERQLKTEDRMARDEWRRSVFERSKRYEELKQFDAELKNRQKQEAADERRRQFASEIAAIKNGELDDANGSNTDASYQRPLQERSSAHYDKINHDSGKNRHGGGSINDAYDGDDGNGYEREPLATTQL